MLQILTLQTIISSSCKILPWQISMNRLFHNSSSVTEQTFRLTIFLIAERVEQSLHPWGSETEHQERNFHEEENALKCPSLISRNFFTMRLRKLLDMLQKHRRGKPIRSNIPLFHILENASFLGFLFVNRKFLTINKTLATHT